MKLKGKIALVTGAAMGNGYGAAKVLAEHGAAVILLDVSDAVHTAAKKLTAEGLRAEAFIADVRDLMGLKEVATEVARKYGKIDILVNNAGGVQYRAFLGDG